MAWSRNFLPMKFIKCREDLSGNISENSEKRDETAPSGSRTISGPDVRQFYEDVIHNKSAEIKPSQSSPNPASKRAKRCKSDANCQPGETVVSQRNINQFLKAAQNGDLKAVQTLHKAGVSLDVVDGYGWSALMCAVKAEQDKVVQYLVSSGADVNIQDSQGLSVFDLLENCKSECISRIFNPSSVDDSDNDAVDQEFFCDLCKKSFTESQKKHQLSTLHRFNRGKRPRSTMYHLPETNRGFQMMLRSGWDKESGLGPEGQGKKFPVKTVLKQDRKGLGDDKNAIPRITHFGPGDVKAVEDKRLSRKTRVATLKKKDHAKALLKQRRKEINFRQQFNME